MTKTDGDQVQAVVGGDRSAYAALYDRHAPLVRAICHDTTRDLHRAQDLAQEIFLKAYRKLGALREPDHFAAWLVGITRNECRDWIRRQACDRHEFTACLPDPSRSGSASLSVMGHIFIRDALDFDVLVRGAMAEFSDDGVVPESIAFDRVMALTTQRRESQAKQEAGRKCELRIRPCGRARPGRKAGN